MPFLDQMLDQIFDIVAFNAIAIIGSYQLFMKGYKMGAGSVEMLVNHRSTKILEALSLLGIFVMGGVAASYVNLVTGLEYITKDGVDINVQLMLNGIFPKLLPLIVVLGTWFAMAMKGQSPVKAMLSLVVLFFIGVAVFFSKLEIQRTQSRAFYLEEYMNSLTYPIHRIRAWLKDDALPIWISTIDKEKGLFAEGLNQAGPPSLPK